MYYSLVLFVGFFSFPRAITDSVTTVSGSHAPVEPFDSGDLIFYDEFDEFDLSKWEHEVSLGGGGNGEFQWYTNNRTNTYVEDGVLHIKPTFTADQFGEEFLYSGTLDVNGGSPADSCTNPTFFGCLRTGSRTHIINPVKSGRIRTLNSFNFKYGRLEALAKIPTGDWLWPAIWLLPRRNAYGGWPASGEINVLESRGNENLLNAEGVNIGVQQVSTTLHFGSDYLHNGYPHVLFDKHSDDGFNNGFHLYAFEWSPDNITFLVDDEVIDVVTPPEGGFWELGELEAGRTENPYSRASKIAPFDQEFYIIINLAVGGDFFPEDATNPGGKPWKVATDTSMTDFWAGKKQWIDTWDLSAQRYHFQIDYVKVWAL